jgi:hypothetical protein
MNAALTDERPQLASDDERASRQLFEDIPPAVLFQDSKAWNVSPASFSSPNRKFCNIIILDLFPPSMTKIKDEGGESVKLENVFNKLSEKWKKETGGCSLTIRRYAHPAYQSILTLGEGVIPLILRELKQCPDWWFEAMKALAKTDPTKPGDNFNDATSAWLNWGKQRNLIS